MVSTDTKGTDLGKPLKPNGGTLADGTDANHAPQSESEKSGSQSLDATHSKNAG
jgi:hypothetical protein